MEAPTLDRAYPGLFSPQEAQAIAALQEGPVALPARHRLVRTGAAGDVLYLTQGFVSRYRADRFGQRQILGLQVPGDYIDLPAFVLGHPDHEVETIGAATVCRIPHAGLQGLRGEAPALFEKFWRLSLIDDSINRYWVFRMGRLAGRARVANFLCEMLLRLYARGLCGIEQFPLPITQTDLAEACGMTPVHACRMLAELRGEGICSFDQGVVRIAKLPELVRTGQYSWDYLYLDADLDRAFRERTAMRRAGDRPGAVLPRIAPPS